MQDRLVRLADMTEGEYINLLERCSDHDVEELTEDYAVVDVSNGSFKFQVNSGAEVATYRAIHDPIIDLAGPINIHGIHE